MKEQIRSNITLHGFPPKVMIALRDQMDYLRENTEGGKVSEKAYYLSGSIDNIGFFSTSYPEPIEHFNPKKEYHLENGS